ARPPREVSLYLSFMSAPVSRIVLITLSSDTKWVPSPRKAIRAALIAFTEPIALRSMQGTCTRPPTGSQVSPRLCSMPISAAFSTCSGVPPSTSASAPAAIEQATPTSPWHPTSAPERVQVHPVQDRRRVTQGRLGRRRQLSMQLGRAPAQLDPTRQHAFAAAAAPHAVLHRLPDARQPGVRLGLGTPCGFVLDHQPADRDALAAAALEQLGPAAERVRQRPVVLADPVGAGRALVHHEAAADRVVLLRDEL